MKLSKRIIAVGAVASALTLGAAGFVAAAGVQGNGPASVLSSLVDDGTLTQKQADKVGDAFEEHRDEMKGQQDEQRAQMQALITSTLGISEEDLEAARQDGTTLADLAGDQKEALIAAIADHMNSAIDRGVPEGKLTQTQADKMKANATERATDIVEGNGGPGRGGPGGPGHGRGGPGAGGPGLGGPGGADRSSENQDSGSTENSGFTA
jgi:polyhydroxyalkanoate synthesis regulator phasin